MNRDDRQSGQLSQPAQPASPLASGCGTIVGMASKGKPSPRSAVSPLSDTQVAKLAAKHTLVDPTKYYPTGPRTPNQAEIDAQNPKATKRLLAGVSVVFRASCKTRAWGLEHVPETGPFITAASHVTMFDVFVPMMSLFHMGRRPRYMAKAEMASWPLIGKWFQLVGMQPVKRHSGQAKAIEETSISILTSGRPLTIWPEGTVTRDPKKWVMSIKEGVGYIALESSRRLGRQVPIFPAITWGAASINHWWPWPRKNVVMCYDEQLDYADLLADMDSWGAEPPAEAVNELTWRVFRRMNAVLEEIRGEAMPEAGYWDYRAMARKPWPAQTEQ
ncbi:phospholipid/glycerol acyltransferase [Bifidobacterium sp. DSM 109957]|uniref:Phospholipid/glycerol acyltransferase n=2 Tax=Bifidobacterium oedipodis TaxID=2675322 RepID=A0A7Y0HU98_9BIFI|nr:phospholipid/glycerol acyltransferase [Bifidobacterium sp. DSM 109957]